MRLVSSFAFGLLFAIGLGVAGMTQPAKIRAFLDVGGNWDPSLAFVMGLAVAVGLVAFPLVLRRGAPLLERRFVLPEAGAVDAPLVIGAGLFGAGWGLSGYCPGPALVSLVTFSPRILVFVVFMAAGLLVGRRLHQRRAARNLAATAAAPP